MLRRDVLVRCMSQLPRLFVTHRWAIAPRYIEQFTIALYNFKMSAPRNQRDCPSMLQLGSMHVQRVQMGLHGWHHPSAPSCYTLGLFPSHWVSSVSTRGQGARSAWTASSDCVMQEKNFQTLVKHSPLLCDKLVQTTSRPWPVS